jgi:ribonuclease HI
MKTVIWTDGSCNVDDIKGLGGWAAIIQQGDEVREISGSARDTTHNRMELTAVCEALAILSGPIEIRTDSSYVSRCFRDRWFDRWRKEDRWRTSKGPVKNRDLWERLLALVEEEAREVEFVWVGRGVEENNRRADRLAGETARREL